MAIIIYYLVLIVNPMGRSLVILVRDSYSFLLKVAWLQKVLQPRHITANSQKSQKAFSTESTPANSHKSHRNVYDLAEGLSIESLQESLIQKKNDSVFLWKVSTERPAFLLKLLQPTHIHNATESTPANLHKSDRNVCDFAGVLSIESREGSFKFDVLHKMAQGLSAETWQGSLKFTTHTMTNVLRPMTVVLYSKYFVRFRCFDFDRIAARNSFFRFFT